MADRNRIVTPYTDPDRFTPREKAHFDKGLCCEDIGADWTQPDNLCGKPSKPGAPFGYCAEHERKLLENHWPDGSPRR